MPVVFARFVCALFGFCAREFPAKSEKQVHVLLNAPGRDMWPRQSHVLSPLVEAVRGPKCRKMLWNNALEESFKELQFMVSAETLLSYLYWRINFMVHTNVSDKYLGDFISHNNKPITLFSRRIRNPQCN